MSNKVLLIGGNEQLQLALKFLFEMNGYIPDTASSSREALARLESGKTDFVLIDLNVGQDEWAKILTHIEALDIPPSNVVVALTEHLGNEQLARIRALARKVIFRPISFEQLLTEIQIKCLDA